MVYDNINIKGDQVRQDFQYAFGLGPAWPLIDS